MGGGLQAGAGGELSLRLRLLSAAVAIVAVSLVLSGLLTWVLVRNLEYSNAQERLDQQVILDKAKVNTLQCATKVVASNGACTRPATGFIFLAPIDTYRDDLSNLAGVDRLLLLDGTGMVVFDSADKDLLAQLPAPGAERIVNREKVGDFSFTLHGLGYLGAATPLPERRDRVQVNGTPTLLVTHGDPLGAHWLVVARPAHEVAARTTAELVPKLLLAGGVSLLVALVVTLILGQAMVRPLKELASAAEDIAAGNYGRRVKASGRDEIGVVGRAFNRMAEAVERARGLQRDFLASVSHELKTPLTSLIGFSQALVDGSLETEAEKHRAATILHEEAVRVLRMSQELLDLARVEGGHLSLRQVAVDLGDMLNQEIEIFRQRASARRLTLSLEVPYDLPPVKADPERLHQILENLLDNAVKYTPEGGEIEIDARSAPGEVETTVTNPVGRHAPDPERMFERFYRADPSRSSAAGGVGLGLSISRELASAQLGRLWADFDPGGRLRLHLNLQAVAHPAASQLDEPRTVQLDPDWTSRLKPAPPG